MLNAALQASVSPVTEERLRAEAYLRDVPVGDLLRFTKEGEEGQRLPAAAQIKQKCLTETGVPADLLIQCAVTSSRPLSVMLASCVSILYLKNKKKNGEVCVACLKAICTAFVTAICEANAGVVDTLLEAVSGAAERLKRRADALLMWSHLQECLWRSLDAFRTTDLVEKISAVIAALDRVVGLCAQSLDLQRHLQSMVATQRSAVITDVKNIVARRPLAFRGEFFREYFFPHLAAFAVLLFERRDVAVLMLYAEIPVEVADLNTEFLMKVVGFCLEVVGSFGEKDVEAFLNDPLSYAKHEHQGSLRIGGMVFLQYFFGHFQVSEQICSAVRPFLSVGNSSITLLRACNVTRALLVNPALSQCFAKEIVTFLNFIMTTFLCRCSAKEMPLEDEMIVCEVLMFLSEFIRSRNTIKNDTNMKEVFAFLMNGPLFMEHRRFAISHIAFVTIQRIIEKKKLRLKIPKESAVRLTGYFLSMLQYREDEKVGEAALACFSFLVTPDGFTTALEQLFGIICSGKTFPPDVLKQLYECLGGICMRVTTLPASDARHRLLNRIVAALWLCHPTPQHSLLSIYLLCSVALDSAANLRVGDILFSPEHQQHYFGHDEDARLFLVSVLLQERGQMCAISAKILENLEVIPFTRSVTTFLTAYMLVGVEEARGALHRAVPAMQNELKLHQHAQMKCKGDVKCIVPLVLMAVAVHGPGVLQGEGLNGVVQTFLSVFSVRELVIQGLRVETAGWVELGLLRLVVEGWAGLEKVLLHTSVSYLLDVLMRARAAQNGLLDEDEELLLKPPAFFPDADLGLTLRCFGDAPKPATAIIPFGSCLDYLRKARGQEVLKAFIQNVLKDEQHIALFCI